MLIAVFGQMGSGKTLMMSILAKYFSFVVPDLPVYANYSLTNSLPVKSIQDILKVRNGLLCLDEFWTTMDSRDWKNRDVNLLTHWINQTRKKNLLVFYTTQHFKQIDVRVRRATDLLIFCERFRRIPPFFRYSFLSNNFTILKSLKMPEASARQFYSFYDTYQLIYPIKNERFKRY